MPINKLGGSSSKVGSMGFLTSEVMSMKNKISDTIDSLFQLAVSLDKRMAEIEERENSIIKIEEEMAKCRELAQSIIRLNLRGKVFEVYKDTLLKREGTYFWSLLSSNMWRPDQGDAYFIDRRNEGFERILDYLSTGKLSLLGLNEYEIECIHDNLDYFQIPYSPRLHFSSFSTIEAFSWRCSCVLSDGRLCVASNNFIKLWNTNSKTFDMTFAGHVGPVDDIIELTNGSICTGSRDNTIKIWDTPTGTCKLSLYGHSDLISCLTLLENRKICSGSFDFTIKIWNVERSICERSFMHGAQVRCVAELLDGRICSGAVDHTIKIWGIASGECEIILRGHIGKVLSLASIDRYRICSSSSDKTVKVWDITSGTCERSLEGHAKHVRHVIRLTDGRICSASEDGTLRIWDPESGECEALLDCSGSIYNVFQMQDGALLASGLVSSLGATIEYVTCIWK